MQDISCVGQCSTTVALPILSACGLEACILPTALLSTHTGGFKNFTFHDLTQEIDPISDHWANENIHFDAIYTGYLGSFEQIDLVGKFFDRFGGDGTLAGATLLSEMGLKVIGLPGTIDNDIGCTDYTIGYDTAMNTALEMIDKLRDTTQSHDRCSVVEVMGHHAGYIALNVGIATGAVAVLLPEIPFDFERDILDRMRQTQVTGKKHFIIIVSEGVIDANELANQIQAATGVDSRATVLGHIQRGGSPTVRDRVNASLMGYHAIDLLDKGIYNRVVAVSGDKIVDYDVNVALSMHKTIDRDMIEIANTISI